MELHISKLDAAKRQLEAAIHLFFRAGDPVSIHTLAGAAFRILDDIGSKQDIKSIHKQLLDWVKLEKKDEVSKAINAAKNFFKHADSDPNGIIKFNPESTTYYLMDASRMYYSLSQQNVPIFKLYDIWFAVRHPDIMLPDENQKLLLENAVALSKLNPMNPQSFLVLLPVVEEIIFNFNLPLK